MDKIIARLKENLGLSYSPYSNYPVSSAVETKDGAFYYGVNVENASYGATICAERVAIMKAVSDGRRKGDLKRLYVMVGSGSIGMPCFLCRQVISEFYEEDAEVVVLSTQNEKKVFTVAELCPFPFGPDDL